MSGERATRSRPKLITWLRGDLDWIVMKCLEKDRARRYETANDLAADIQRHLDHQPIQARAVNAAGRFWKWCRRYPAIAALSTGVLLLLVVVAIGSSVSAWRVTSARRSEHVERTKAELANRELRGANSRLADTVSLLELQRAEDSFPRQRLFRRRGAAHRRCCGTISPITSPPAGWSRPYPPQLGVAGWPRQ